SAGGAHARNARRLIHAARKQDRRLAAALLAAALAHTPEAEEALRGARTRMARKPPALARELLRNFPKRRARNARRRRKGARGQPSGEAQAAAETGVVVQRNAAGAAQPPEGAGVLVRRGSRNGAHAEAAGGSSGRASELPAPDGATSGGSANGASSATEEPEEPVGPGSAV
ncbi:MAG TPA: hypothetical protein VN772_04815, partial [Solirubrobacteraceae bacterium]|nr:hypothetical protein [Solirubrobacteraceae bacterium]